MRTGAWGRGWILAGAALAGIAGEIEFGPEPGTALERRWSEKLRLEVDVLKETVDGNPIDLPFNSIELEGHRAFEVGDELARSDGGRPVDLTRRYTASSLGLALHLDGRPVGHVVGSSVSDGSAVRFLFDGDEELYARERIEGEIDARRMDRLEPDLDLLELLPPGEIEVGATWEPEPEALRRFLAAGGDLGFELTARVAEMDNVPPEILVAGALGSLHELFTAAGELSGKVEGTYVSVEDDDESDATLARLEFELEVAAEADLGERLRSFIGENALKGRREFHLAAELEGQLVVLWDVTSKHLHSARFEGEAGLTGHVVFPVVLLESRKIVEFQGHYELSGDAEVELVVE